LESGTTRHTPSVVVVAVVLITSRRNDVLHVATPVQL